MQNFQLHFKNETQDDDVFNFTNSDELMAFDHDHQDKDIRHESFLINGVKVLYAMNDPSYLAQVQTLVFAIKKGDQH